MAAKGSFKTNPNNGLCVADRDFSEKVAHCESGRPGRLIHSLLERFFHLLPAYCLLCGQGMRPARLLLCSGCNDDLPRIVNPCRRCGLPLPATQNVARICGRCLTDAPVHQTCIAPFSYDEPIRQLLNAFKHQEKLIYGALVAELLLEHLQAVLAGPVWNMGSSTLIVPMPAHPQKLRARGYNQALLIARTIARHLQLPLDYQSVVRVKSTPSQQGLSADERRRNMREAFVCRAPLRADRVVIVDDVMTTGASCAALSEVLRDAGAEEVHIWVVARTIRKYR